MRDDLERSLKTAIWHIYFRGEASQLSGRGG
jgi:hypothetical protein